MKLIDTHNHIYLEEFDPEQDRLIDIARTSGIDTLLLPNVDTETIGRMHAICERYPDFAYPMMGLHPTSVDHRYAETLKTIEKQFSQHSYCAVGEIGIDLYWDRTYLKEQKEVFEEQLQWSIDAGLPVAIHTRDAFPEVFDSIYKTGAEKLSGVFHCFTGNEEELEEINRLDHFKIGINGVVTFKNSTLPELLTTCDLQKIVLETDAPYLAPVPYRGKRNEPAYIWKTAEKVAEIFRTSLEEIVFQTRKNALQLFISVKKDL